MKKPVKNMKDVFERIKDNLGLKTDREVWERIGLSRAFFQDAKAGRKHLSEETALKIAADARLTPESMLVLLAREKATSVEIKAVWDKIISRECRIMDIM